MNSGIHTDINWLQICFTETMPIRQAVTDKFCTASRCFVCRLFKRHE